MRPHKTWVNIFLVALFCLSFSLHALESPYDLMQIYALAEKKDPFLASAQFENEAYHELIQQSKSLFLPTISFSATYNQNSNTRKSFTDLSRTSLNHLGTSRANFDDNQMGLYLRQPLLNYQNYIKYQQSLNQVSGADKKLLQKKQIVILKVVQVYFDALFLKTQIQLLEAQMESIHHQLDEAQAKFEAGLVSVVDIQEAKTKASIIKTQTLAATQDLKIKMREIQSLIGELPVDIKSLHEETLLHKPDQSMQELLDVASQNNFDIKIKEIELKLAEQDIDLKKSGHLPTLDLVASSQTSSAYGGYPYGTTIENKGQRIESNIVGIELNIPIYSGGLVSSQVRQASLNQNKAFEDLASAKRDVELEVKQHYLNMESYNGQITAYEESLDLAAKQLESTRLGFREGFRNSLEVLNAQELVFSTKKNLMQARYNFLVTMIKLKKSIGLLSEYDIKEINQYLIGSESSIKNDKIY